MLRNYFKVIIRNLYRHRLYATINVSGLAMGFASFLLIILYLHYETTFEHFHKKSNRIYRPTYSFFNSASGYSVKWARIPLTFINELPNEFPEVEKLIRFQNHERKYVRINKEKFHPNHAYQTDNEVFEVFDLPLIAGDPKTALKEPYSVVLTKSLATKYFGRTDILGEDIIVTGDWNPEETHYKITGVMEDLPSNTHLPIEMLFSFGNADERTGWAYVYILLQEHADIETIKSKLPAFIQKYADEGSADKINFEFQPLRTIHLHSNLAREIIPNGNVEYVYIFVSIGMFILLIALINYTNLETTMILGRIKESGLRKILGAKSGQIINYFLLESILHHMAAMVLAGALVLLIFPYFKSLTSIEVALDPIWMVSVMVVLPFVCGLLTGLYPAWLLNRSNSVQSLKQSGTVSLSKKGQTINLKRVLVTLQYSISVLLIGSAFVARDQFKFLSKSNLGITREQILAIPGVPDKVKDGYQGFKEHLLTSSSDILQVSACMEVPSREIRDSGPVLINGTNNDPADAPVMDIQVIDDDYLTVLEIELAGGENIPSSLKNDPIPEFTQSYTYVNYLQDRRRVYLINETAMKQLGWKSPEEAIGQEISWSISDINLGFGPISGVVKDYHQETLKNTIDPTIMVYEPIWLRTFLIKLKTDHIQETIAGIKAIWDEQFPQYPMEYHFLDDLYEDLYKNERVKLELLYLLSGQAIIISFIGLFGLIAFALKTRIKEIAIRKVLGADVGKLIKLIGQEYLLILFIASIIAVPLSYFFINQWLQQFAYKAGISFANYGITISLMALLILFTISFQTIKTSAINPADTLREE